MPTWPPTRGSERSCSKLEWRGRNVDAALMSELRGDRADTRLERPSRGEPPGSAPSEYERDEPATHATMQPGYMYRRFPGEARTHSCRALLLSVILGAALIAT